MEEETLYGPWFNVAGWCLRVEPGTHGVGTVNETDSAK